MSTPPMQVDAGAGDEARSDEREPPAPPRPPGDADAGRGASLVPPSPSGRAVLGEALALASLACLVGSVPAALRAGRADGSSIGGWLASAAVLLPIVALFLALSRAAGRGFRMVTGVRVGRGTATGMALWVGLSAPLLVVAASALKAVTNHRGLGGATFGVVGLLVVILAAVVARRLLDTGRSLLDRGVPPAAIAAGIAGLALGPTALVALGSFASHDASQHASLVSAALVDGALVTVAAALAGTTELTAHWRERARTLGLLVGLALFAAGFGWLSLSPSLGAAMRRGGGLAAALVSGLERWTDRDGDGMGSSFGGADCDEGDPRRRPGLGDAPGDGLDQDCDGVDGAPASAPATVLAAAPLGGDAAPTAPTRKPDVILVTLDTVRASRTSAYGYARKTTPRLEALAAEGTLFERAYAPSSDTQRAIVAVVSGKRLSETPRDRREWPTLLPEALTVAERMQSAGYLTAAVSSFTWMSKERGFDQGFERFEEVFRKDHPERGVTGPHAVAAARAVIEQAESDPRPLFLWVHLFDAHARYVRHDGFDFGRGEGGAYDSEVAFVDAQLGSLVDAVRGSKARSGAVFVVHGSQGEALGEHDERGHGDELWEEMVRVPLVVSEPGAPRGARLAGRVVSTFDVVPTLLALSGQSGDGLEGESLLGAVRAKAEGPRAPLVLAARRRWAVVDGTLKLIEIQREGKRKPRHLLFDLAADPAEEKDVSSSRPDDVARLLALLEAAQRRGPTAQRE